MSTIAADAGRIAPATLMDHGVPNQGNENTYQHTLALTNASKMFSANWLLGRKTSALWGLGKAMTGIHLDGTDFAKPVRLIR